MVVTDYNVSLRSPIHENGFLRGPKIISTEQKYNKFNLKFQKSQNEVTLTREVER